MASIVVAVAGTGIAVAGLAVLLVLLRRRVVDSPLRGTDRETQKAVRRALRTGRAEDPRIVELARQVAANTPRMRWAPWVFAAMTALQAVVLVDRVRDRDSGGWLTALLLVYFAALWTHHVVLQRRLARFRGNRPGTPPVPAQADPQPQ